MTTFIALNKLNNFFVFQIIPWFFCVDLFQLFVSAGFLCGASFPRVFIDFGGRGDV